MSNEVLEHAIDPFFTTKPRGHGTGLGLTTAHGIIAQAGGHLTIHSALRHGTTLRIRLPLAPTSPDGPHATKQTHRDSDSRTILVVDDDEDIRFIVTRMLRKTGYEILTAADGQQAMTIAEQHAGVIDAVITDVMMPVMNGRELAQRFTATNPGTPILFISGYAAAIIDEQGILDPGATVLTKPFTQQQLLTAVHHMLGIRV